MPRRSSQVFASRGGGAGGGGAGGGGGADDLRVFRCRFTGAPVLVTTTPLAGLPRRGADGASALDTGAHPTKVLEGARALGARVLRRKDGRLERQHRLGVGPDPALPVAYRVGRPDAPVLYLLSGALEDSGAAPADLGGGGEGGAGGAGDAGARRAPPCIRRRAGAGGPVQVAVAVAGGAPGGGPRLVEVGSEAVVAEVGPALHLPGAAAELAGLFARALDVPPPAVSVGRGAADKPGTRVVLVRGLEPSSVFHRLSAAVGGDGPGGGNGPGGGGGPGT